ncbi:6-bladed beta-propeller [Roseivirga sp. E12]|uniref:6-bladed beta-propeller n=1 Tax=Roseivirga sp. E12 TaxID=2819237 RepID=UPI001ABC9FBB|nr:6-bladed beta-propeller [Roseivirga sp. E12]
MQNLKRYYFAFIIILLSSCSDRKEETDKIVINVNAKTEQLPLSEIITRLDYIPLESGNASFIGAISDVHLFDKKYFVLDVGREQITIFTEEGDYNGKIKFIGNGPGEYSKIDFFDINEFDKTIDIFDIRKGKVLRYDLYGTFVEEIRARIICRDFEVTQKGNYLFYSPDEVNETADHKTLGTGIILMKRNENPKLIAELGNVTYHPILTGDSFVQHKDKVYLFSNYTNTIYEINEDQIPREIELDFGIDIDQSFFTSVNHNIEDIRFPYLKLNPFVLHENLGFTYIYKGKDNSVLIDYNTGKSKTYRGIKNDLDGGFFVINGHPVNNGSNYISILDSDIMSQYEEYISKNPKVPFKSDKLDSLKSVMKLNNNNPILVFGSTL